MAKTCMQCGGELTESLIFCSDCRVPSEEQLSNLWDILKVDMAKMSGRCLFEIRVNWVEQNHVGGDKTYTEIWEAENALKAIESATDSHWLPGIREISLRWLTPVECVRNRVEKELDSPD